MNKRRVSKDSEPDKAELDRIHRELVISLAMAMGATEHVQRKFRNCVLIRLSKIETMLTDVLGCQLAQCWSEGKVSDEKRTQYVREVEERSAIASEQLGLKMIRYIYGETEVTEARHDRRRKWWGWEI
jgi:hypothetical protein